MGDSESNEIQEKKVYDEQAEQPQEKVEAEQNELEKQEKYNRLKQQSEEQGGEGKGDDCELAIAFDGNGCKKPEKPLAEPECLSEGQSCEEGKECCDDMECEKGESKWEDCDLAIAFESGECESKSICKKPERPQVLPKAEPQCVLEGQSCEEGKECCDD